MWCEKLERTVPSSGDAVQYFDTRPEVVLPGSPLGSAQAQCGAVSFIWKSISRWRKQQMLERRSSVVPSV